jgi:hypothetical protein
LTGVIISLQRKTTKIYMRGSPLDLRDLSCIQVQIRAIPKLRALRSEIRSGAGYGVSDGQHLARYFIPNSDTQKNLHQRHNVSTLQRVAVKDKV